MLGSEPVSQIMQVMGEGAKRTHWCIRHVGIDCRHVFTRTDINSRSADVHRLPPVGNRRAWAMQIRHLPNRDHRRAASPLSSSHQPMDHVF